MEELELQIVSNGMDGDGIAKKDGKVYFVKNAINGECVLASVYQNTKSFSRAKTNKVISQSNQRVIPPCPYYNECGGCSFQHINYEYGLNIKKKNIQTLLNKNKLNAVVNDVIKSDKTYAYRNKITLYSSSGNVLGFYKENSKEIVPINGCLLVDEKFNNIIKIINKFLIINKNFALNLKGVSVREVNNIFILNLILQKNISLKDFENYLKINKIKYSLYYCVNNKDNIVKYPCEFVGGIKEVFVQEFNITYQVLPMSFLQVNNEVKQKIYSNVLGEISDSDVVLDAYSGAGLLSAIIAQKAKQVLAVEIDKQANFASKNLAVLNDIKNMTSVLGDCANIVPKLLSKEKVNTIILDPARKGCDSKILNAILTSGAKKIIYISCNPATLTRDLKELCSKYEITEVQPYDMFPQTSEVETVVKLKIKKG